MALAAPSFAVAESLSNKPTQGINRLSVRVGKLPERLFDELGTSFGDSTTEFTIFQTAVCCAFTDTGRLGCLLHAVAGCQSYQQLEIGRFSVTACHLLPVLLLTTQSALP